MRFRSAALSAFTLAVVATSVRAVEFAKDIRPILESRCVSCHGRQKQKNGLRLDSRAGAIAGGDSGKVILPGKSADSPLVQRVTNPDKSERMPPTGEPLSPAQIAVLKTWIDQGAAWPDDGATSADRRDWWAYKPIVRPAVPPAGADPATRRNPIDSFILKKLAENGLTPSPEADRRTLIRRLYFDLIGLPPSPTAVDEFVASPDPLVYEKLVDRLLASPAYGERWARHWLDVVHYGDTHGYDKDKPRPNAWPYRDYVIRSLNADKPYARFVQEQIAGDVLFPTSPDGFTATGFIAAGPWDFIGHAEVPESKIDGKIARLLDRDDMVSNTFNTFLSTTVQCARCHNHKFDPITQEDYYRLQAVFAALDRADRAFDADPAIAKRRASLEGRQRDLVAKKKQIDEKITRLGGVELADLGRKIATASAADGSPKAAAFGYHSAIEPRDDHVKWVQVDLGKVVEIDALAYVGCHDAFAGIGAGFGFPRRFKVETATDEGFSNSEVIVDRTREDVPNPGVAPQRVAVRVKKARYVRFTATKLAPRSNDFIFALAELMIFDKAGKNLAEGATVTARDSIESPPRWRKQNLVDGYYYGIGSNLAELKKQRDALLARVADDAARAEQAEVAMGLAEVGRDLARLPAPQVVYAGTVHTGSGAFSGTGPTGGKPRPVHVLKRGDVRTPDKEVGPGTFPLLPGDTGTFELPPDHSERDRRAALAHWVTDPRHPLTWRSIVNRVWQYHFGRGLVDSPNDFGHMGRLPSHPELLDWLAAELRDNRQSLKVLHRLMVTSTTYRQSSASDEVFSKIDSGNVFLWRMNRRKLEAEAVRDAALAVAGKLDSRMSGPGFQDFVIEKPEHSPHYQYHLYDPENPNTHRRSVYRFLVRSQPQPFMTTLDCADPSMSVDKRNETLTALQALALMNNRFILTMAKHMAEHVERAAATPEARVELAFRNALGRDPTAAERDALVQYAKTHGLANVCRVILNLNEFVFVD